MSANSDLRSAETFAKKPVAVVTGACGGIGRLLVPALLDAGSHVVAVDRDGEALDALQHAVTSHSMRLVCCAADLASETGRSLVASTVQREFGYLTCLINNAAIGMSSIRRDYHNRAVTHREIDGEIVDRFLQINARVPIDLALRLLPLFKLTWGRIINVGTSFAAMLRPGFLPYGMSKAALEAGSAVLAAELRDSGITVNVLNPGGPVDTPMAARSDSEQRRLLIPPQIMVKPVCWLASRASDGFTGRRITATRWNDAAVEAAAFPIGWPQLATDSSWRPAD
jgi:NAD(P)-dependent dehydrogenase (short-subunit alcohol dehydrogenase family)